MTLSTTNKKISDYTFEDLKTFFYNLTRKISSKIILIEIGNDFFNIAIAKCQNKQLLIKKVYSQKLPTEALEKFIPKDPVAFGNLILGVLQENKLPGQRVAILLPSDTCYTRLIEIPEKINQENSKEFLEDPSSGIQIPISINNSDFDINLTSLPKMKLKNKVFNKYFLTSIPKKNVNLILNSLKNANLELCSLQMSHVCLANLLETEIKKLNNNQLLIAVELLDEFSQFIIFDTSGPILLKRFGSIRNYPTIEERMSPNNESENNKKQRSNYHPISKLDVKVLTREIKGAFTNFLKENDLEMEGKVFLTGRNSQHKNLVEVLGESLNMNVSLISPIGHPRLTEFEYDPEKIDQFSMSRIIGLGISLLREEYIENLNDEDKFVINKYVNLDSKNISKVGFKNSELKNKTQTIKVEEKKIEVKEKANELPPLPDLKIGSNKKKVEEKKIEEKGKIKNSSVIEDDKKNKDSFKMDTTFLDID